MDFLGIWGTLPLPLSLISPLLSLFLRSSHLTPPRSLPLPSHSPPSSRVSPLSFAVYPVSQVLEQLTHRVNAFRRNGPPQAVSEISWPEFLVVCGIATSPNEDSLKGSNLEANTRNHLAGKNLKWPFVPFRVNVRPLSGKHKFTVTPTYGQHEENISSPLGEHMVNTE